MGWRSGWAIGGAWVHGHPNWGDVPTWIAAIGTAGALLLTGVALIMQKRALDDERRQRETLEKRYQASEEERNFLQASDQARLVGAFTTGGGPIPNVTVNVTNQSPLPVHNFEIVAFAEDPNDGSKHWIDFVRPGQAILIVTKDLPATLTRPAPRLFLAWRLEIVFTDDNGRRRHKYGPEPLRPVAKDFELDVDEWSPDPDPPANAPGPL